MNTRSVHPAAGVLAGGALVCALLPLIPLLSIVTSHSAAFLFGPNIAIVLAVATLVLTFRRPPSNARFLAWASLAVISGWALLLVALGVALRLE